MNLVDSLNHTEQEPRIDSLIAGRTYNWNISNIISNNSNVGILSDSISVSRAQVDLSDETINTIAERVYELIRLRGIE